MDEISYSRHSLLISSLFTKENQEFTFVEQVEWRLGNRHWFSGIQKESTESFPKRTGYPCQCHHYYYYMFNLGIIKRIQHIRWSYLNIWISNRILSHRILTKTFFRIRYVLLRMLLNIMRSFSGRYQKLHIETLNLCQFISILFWKFSNTSFAIPSKIVQNFFAIVAIRILRRRLL